MMLEGAGLPHTAMMWVDQCQDQEQRTPHDPLLVDAKQNRYGPGTRVRYKIYVTPDKFPKPGDCLLLDVTEYETRGRANTNTGLTSSLIWVVYTYKILTPEEANAYEDMQDPGAASSRRRVRAMQFRP